MSSGSNAYTWNAFQQRLESESSTLMNIRDTENIGMDTMSLLDNEQQDSCGQSQRRMQRRKPKNKGGAICILVIVILVVVLAILGLNISSVVHDVKAKNADEEQQQDINVIISHIELIKHKQEELHRRVRQIADEEPGNGELYDHLGNLKQKIIDLDNGQEDIEEALDHLKRLLIEYNEDSSEEQSDKNTEHHEDDDDDYAKTDGYVDENNEHTEDKNNEDVDQNIDDYDGVEGQTNTEE